MYLRKLEIQGFKSFPQKTSVVFDRGITAIVGPNGCGKTNIVDAIRWCLGEQKSRTLRTEKMENVIFNGTSKKKPMGMAEVSLTIENDKGVLPTEYKEVIITRRIFSSGESEYLLNKNVSRLKDITNLFMDTGMGANAYSVIELKMVETILSSKAEERRVLFEEAAGVNKYKVRRRLTLRKLEDVKTDLMRVNDIVAEVEKKTIQLERQAKKADKANEIRTELTEKEMGLAEREYALFQSQKNEWNSTGDELNRKRSEAKEKLTSFDEQLREVKAGQSAIEQELRDKRNALSTLVEKIHKNEQTISVSREGRRSLERNIEKFSQELSEFQEQLEIMQDTLEDNTSKLKDMDERIERHKAEKESVTGEVEQKRKVLEEKGKELQDFSELLLEKFKEDTNKQSELNSLDKESQRIDREIQKKNDQIQSLTGTIAKTVGYIEELSGEREQIANNVDEAEKTQAQKQQEKESLENSLGKLQSDELEKKGVINELQNKIDFLQSLIDNLEGFSKGTKALLETEEWSAKEKNLLANIGKTDEKYQFAIEAALKNNLNNIIVNSVGEIENAVEFLSETEKGKASFLIYEGDDEKANSLFDKIDRFVTKRRVQKLEKEEGFITWAADVIQTEDRWKPFFRKLLINTAVVDTLENALRFSKQFPLFNFTTLTGDVVYQTGVIEAGSEPKLDDTLFGRRQLLENLKKELPAHQQQLENLHQEIESLKIKISEIDLKALAEKVKILFNDLTSVDKQISRFEFEKKKAVDETENVREEINALVSQSNELREEKRSLESILENRAKEKEEAEQEKASLQEEYHRLELDYNNVLSSRNEMNLTLERNYGEKKNTENSIQRAQESIRNIERGISKRHDDIESAREEMSTLNEIIDVAEDDLQELFVKRDASKREEESIDEKYNSMRNSINELEQQQDALRREIDKFGGEIHACEMNQREIEINTKNLLGRIREKYNKAIELKEFDDLHDYDFDLSREEVNTLEQKIKTIGPVNSLAYEEYEEEKERLDFLLKQRNDLIQSEKDLLKTIDEINTKAKILFTETYELIRTNFIQIFQRLFNPGDEADLRIEEHVDPLEAKIEIIAKPRGKRPTSIELLSGGEKTLTAIALLFAIYLVKPSPFCILDEIDAPLDDANIDRFSKILRDFSKNTQFITVTHNKRTMEMADILYGVTMQEEGISKLVSVKFNEDLNFVA